MSAFTYTQLLAMMQSWPVNASAGYVAAIPALIDMGESRLICDMNLEIFDVVDATFVLDVGTNLVTKPAGLLQLNSMRAALITATNFTAANPTAICLAQAASILPTVLTLNGALGPTPVINPAAQASVTQIAAGNAGIVIVAGLNPQGVAISEQIVANPSAAVLSTNRFSSISSVTSFDGAGDGSTVEVGTAAVTATTLGQSWDVEKRSKAFCDAFNSDPTVVGQPRYFNEISTVDWQVVSSADQNYGIIVHFIERPQSIVTAGTSWMGNNCGELLFAASLMEAERFLKADDRFEDIAGDYAQKMAARKMELSDSIRMGKYSPFKPAAEKAP